MGETRPLLQSPDPEEAVRRLLLQREPFYAMADAVVATDGRSAEEVARDVLAIWVARR